MGRSKMDFPIDKALATALAASTEKSKEPKKTKGAKLKKCLKRNWLTLATFGAVILGGVVGYLLREANAGEPYSQRTVMYINFPGELFLRMLKGLILPLIVASLVSAVGSLDSALSGRIGIRAIAYYMATTILAIILGLVLVTAIRPGRSGNVDEITSSSGTKSKVLTTADTLLDLVRNMFPPNYIEACVSQYSTVLTMPVKKVTTTQSPEVTTVFTMIEDNATEIYTNLSEINTTSQTTTETPIPITDWHVGGSMMSGTNILGLVVFSVVMGAVLGKMGEQGAPLLNVFKALGDAMMKITGIVIWLSPVGVFFLVASKMVEMEDLGVLAGQLGLYTATVLVGLLIHGLIVLPAIYSIFLRKLPFRFMAGMSQAVTTAFATSSSSATLPVTFSCLEERNGVDPRVSRFCLPVGATINMDGTALYEAVAAVFIAQLRGVPLGPGHLAVVSLTATAASIGAAGIPQAGLVTMVMVLNAVGLPADDVAIIFAVDWFLDRFRTAINVLGDAFGAGIVEHLSKDYLNSAPLEEPNTTDLKTQKDADVLEMP